MTLPIRAGTSPCDAVEQPLAELDRLLDDGLGAVVAAVGERVEGGLVQIVGREQHVGQHGGVLQGLAAPWAMVGGQVCAASPMSTTRPRFHGAWEQVGSRTRCS